MSFTSHIVRVGEGWSSSPAEFEPYPSYWIEVSAANAVGAEGSYDDDEELFPDVYVDMAKEAEEKQKVLPQQKNRKKRSLKPRVKRKFYN